MLFHCHSEAIVSCMISVYIIQCTTVSCGEEIQENLENLLAEKEAEMLRLKLEHKRSIGMKESQNRSLQAEVDSLKSQLSDRLRQIHIQQEACQLKDNHIKMLKDMVRHGMSSITCLLRC